MEKFTRRDFARNAAIWAGSATLLPSHARAATAPIFLNDPFQLGVASGDAVADGFVLWTRLAPDPYDRKALPPEAIPVGWEVATDPNFRKIVARGQAYAEPDFAHSVHVDVRGLDHGATYYYRFHCGAAVSRLGRTHTLPTPRLPLSHLRFAFASCQHYEQGYFTAYRDMVAQEPDFIMHLGDYIYEISSGTTVRHQPVNEARTLDDYRLLHAIYKTDPDLQTAHAQFPWYFLWDDHEVANDYSRDQSERDQDPIAFHARKRAAYQAYYEHMPLRPSAVPDADGGVILYQHLNFGDLMEMAITDLRQYRDAIACQPPNWHAGRVVDVTQCDNLNDPTRTVLGPTQERWLAGAWAKTGARWNVLAQSLMLTGFDQMPGPARGIFTDNWGGYPAAKRKILDLVKARQKAGASNFVSLGGDIHGYFISDVKDSDMDPASETLMSEFVGTSVTSESYNTELFQKCLPENPHIKLIDDSVRGYVLCNITPDAWRTTLRVVDNVRTRTPTFRSRADFVLENGRVGVESA